MRSTVMNPLAALTIALAASGCVRSLARESTAGALDAVKAEKDTKKTSTNRNQGNEGNEGDANAGAGAASGGTPGGAVGQAGAKLAGGAGAEILDVMTARHADLRRLTAEMTGAATRSALAEIGPELDRVVRRDLAANGPLTRAIGGVTEAATQSAIRATSRDLEARLAAACPPDTSLRDCLHRETRALSGEVVAGVIDELRWPLRVLAVAAVLITLGACAILGLLFIRMLMSPRGGRPAGRPLVPREA
jgi:hypothetical protein